MTFKEFLNKYLDKSKGYPTDDQYKGECLSVRKLYIKECFGINPPPSGTNSAYGYWTNFPNPLGEVFEKIENTVELIPQEGWIVIWKPWTGNSYGHIAICGDESTKYILHNYAQNWSSKNFTEELCDYDDVIGYLKPKSSIIEDMTTDEKNALTLLESYKINAGHGNLEGAMNTLIGTVTALRNANESIENFKKDIEVLNSQLEAVNAKVAELEAKFIENQKVVASQQKTIATANDKITELNGTIENIKTESNNWQKRYNTKNDDFNALSEAFETYKKSHPETTEAKFNLLDFIKSLFKK